ncbi:phage head morphogenesis protein [Empedobacter falsenii]|uniref:Phage head morphogenesis domain-containing protein n=1 Tax=Empedobacter falsenii TaxID=343874 RepID=A0AAW7DJ74_9FLAO|nr:phage minor head protein [Empedobacter falsenii]MDM1550647.1 hypothetical protein [Empedobacter falsenii]
MHAQGSYNYKDLDQEPYKNLINKTNSFLSKAVTDNNVTGFMKDAFKNDIFIFSHLRTHAQLQEAGSLLLTDDGKIKSFDLFKLDIAKINGLYNENYLQAEYQFAVSSVQMGEKWQNYVESDRYNLQYRTAQDDKVRISHQPLHGITLPMNNPFWDKFYPPNGWRCRCNAVQVRASKYPATNEETALKAGNIATTQIGKDNKNRLEIFRFNSGKQQRVFPPNHPYNKVKDAENVKKDVEKTVKNEKDFVPKILNKYEDKIGVKINREFFSNLEKETPLHFVNPKGSGTKSTGAYFHPTQNFVKIPIDDRRKNSPWYGEAIFYHEYGHAIDWQKGLKNLESLTKLMSKHRELFKKDFEKYKKLDQKIDAIGYRAYKNNNHDLMEMVGAVRDTLKSIDIRIGSGHPDNYFKQKGNSEAEFIAHAFENKYKGNKVFKKYLPELHDEMIKWLENSL